MKEAFCHSKKRNVTLILQLELPNVFELIKMLWLRHTAEAMAFVACRIGMVVDHVDTSK